MVREGNVRMELSLPADLVHRCKGVLLERGLAKKGGMSQAIEEALEAWIAKGGFDRIQESVRADLSAIEAGKVL